MRRAGMSQSELGRMTHITRQYVNDVIRGRRNPEPRTLQAIADALGVTADSLRTAPDETTGPLVRISVAAAHLDVNEETLTRWCRSDPPRIRGAVKVGRTWRIPQSELARIAREGVAA